MPRKPHVDPLTAALALMEQARAAQLGDRVVLLKVAAWRLDEARVWVRDLEDAAESEWCSAARPLVRQHVERRRRAVEDAATTLAALLVA